MEGIFIHVPLEKAVKPISGRCIVDHFWMVNDEGVAFYVGRYTDDEPSPQCNVSKCILDWSEEVKRGVYKVQFIPVVYLSHAYKGFRKVRPAPILLPNENP